MASPLYITYSEAKARLTWDGCIDALSHGHKLRAPRWVIYFSKTSQIPC